MSIDIYLKSNTIPHLSKTVDSADPVLLENSMDFYAGESACSYDTDGRMTADSGRGITSISYNRIDRPECIEMENGACIFYAYDATGQKLAETYRNGNTTSRYYVGALEMVQSDTDTVPRVERFNLPCGYIKPEEGVYAYIPDYQGNVRAVIGHADTVAQTTDYYPYGMPMATSTGAAVNRYKYGSKELETRNGLNFHDFEARMLFNDHTLFNRPDPHAGKYPHLNPYLYCAANPIMFIDPSGKELHYLDDDKEYVYQIVDNQIAVYDVSGNVVDQSTLSQTHQDTINVLNELIKSSTGLSEVYNVIDSDKTVTMTYNESKGNTFNSESGMLTFNPYNNSGGMSYNSTSGKYSRDATAAINLSHEIGHAEDWIKGTLNESIWVNYNGVRIPKSEIYACFRENHYRKEIGYQLRISYLTVRSNMFNDYYPAPQTIINFGNLIIPHKRIMRTK